MRQCIASTAYIEVAFDDEDKHPVILSIRGHDEFGEEQWVNRHLTQATAQTLGQALLGCSNLPHTEPTPPAPDHCH